MDCENCGTRYSDGMCPNCHEELFILVTQVDDLDDVRLSDEFLSKAKDQSKELAQSASNRLGRRRVGQTLRRDS